MIAVRRKLWVGALALLGSSVAASAATFTEGNIAGGTWSSIQGQSFGPGIEPAPAQGLAAGSPVYLTGFELVRSGAGFGDPNANVHLAIMPAAFFDWNGDPDGSFAPTVSDAVGISANSVNPSTLAAGDSILFGFGAGLQLAYGSVYSATYVTLGVGGELTRVAVGSLIADFAEVEPGVFKPSPNYGGESNFDATALFADSDGNGFLEGCGFACDASFQASFSTVPVPEPGSLMVAVCGLAAVAVGRRRGEVSA